MDGFTFFQAIVIAAGSGVLGFGLGFWARGSRRRPLPAPLVEAVQVAVGDEQWVPPQPYMAPQTAPQTAPHAAPQTAPGSASAWTPPTRLARPTAPPTGPARSGPPLIICTPPPQEGRHVRTQAIPVVGRRP